MELSSPGPAPAPGLTEPPGPPGVSARLLAAQRIVAEQKVLAAGRLAAEERVDRLRRRGRRGVRSLTFAIVLALAAVAVVVVRAPRPPAPRADTRLSAAPAPEAPAPTIPAAPAGSLDATLADQSAALLAGDRPAFLAAVDPAAHAAVAAYRRLYDNLRALHVAVFRQFADLGRVPLTSRRAASVEVGFCLVNSGCPQEITTFHLTVAPHGGRALIEGYAPPGHNDETLEPYPWEVSALHVVTGPRVIVAAADDQAYRLPSALTMAQRSAANADRYAKWGRPPVYVVYLAGHRESSVWFDGALKNSIGEEVPLGTDDNEVMIILPDAVEFGPSGLEIVMRHEMGHVATLRGDLQYRFSDDDTLVEGIAEYIAYAGHPEWGRRRLPDVRTYLRRDRWSGECFMTDEIVSDDIVTSSAAYGIGYLLITYLVAKYGLDKMFAFWDAVERSGQTVDAAAPGTLGAPWKTVNSGCAAYVRHRVPA